MPSKAFHDGLRRRCPHSAPSLTHSPQSPERQTSLTAADDDPSVSLAVRTPIHSLSPPLSASAPTIFRPPRPPHPLFDPRPECGPTTSPSQSRGREDETTPAARQPTHRRGSNENTKTRGFRSSLSLCISMQCGPVRKLAHSSKEMESLGRMRTTRRLTGEENAFLLPYLPPAVIFARQEDDLG